MSAPDISQDLLDKFQPLLGDAHLTFLLGAGASAPSGLPDWNDFAAEVAVLSGLVSTKSAAEILLSRQDPTIVLEAARLQAGSSWETNLQKALYGNHQVPARPSALHLAAVGHYAARPTRTTLSTLNFDTLLETALLNEASALSSTNASLASTLKEATVDHLHGIISNEKVHDPIIGFRDYAELVAQKAQWQYDFLGNALSRGPLLLAGTSYRDPDIRHWLHLILENEKPNHGAVVTIVREGLGLSRKKFEAVRLALALEWEAIGLTALQMQDLTDVALVIRELQFINQEGYQSPKARSKQVWETHNHLLTELQPIYSDALESTAKLISDATGAVAHQGTLWLANGEGQLARWASQGTHYLSPRYLKYVPTGHDSPWIAGETLGAEEVKVRDVRRKRKATPSWKSVLAIPLFASDGQTPNFATAVLTFGLSQSADRIFEHEISWADLVESLSNDWGDQISSISFPDLV